MRFDSVKFDDLRSAKLVTLKNLYEDLENYADSKLIDGRPKSLFMTKLEEAYMWAGKAFRDEQLKEKE